MTRVTWPSSTRSSPSNFTASRIFEWPLWLVVVQRERDIQHTATNYFHCARLKNKKAAAAASRPAQTMSYIYLETTAQSQQSKSKPISPTLNIIYLVYIDSLSLSLSLSLPRYNIYIILYSDAYTLCVLSTQRLPVYDTAQQTTFVFFLLLWTFSAWCHFVLPIPFCGCCLPSHLVFCLCNNRPNNFCDVVIF
jgi:hypothetical protein